MNKTKFLVLVSFNYSWYTDFQQHVQWYKNGISNACCMSIVLTACTVEHVQPKGCFAPGGILHAVRNFSLFVSSQPQLIDKRQNKIPLRTKNSA